MRVTQTVALCDDTQPLQAELRVTLQDPMPDDAETADAHRLRLQAVVESQLAEFEHYLNLGATYAAAMAASQAAIHRGLPDGPVSAMQMKLCEALEHEVDQAFGEGARLCGRAVALYAVRDMMQRR